MIRKSNSAGYNAAASSFRPTCSINAARAVAAAGRLAHRCSWIPQIQVVARTLEAMARQIEDATAFDALIKWRPDLP